MSDKNFSQWAELKNVFYTHSNQDACWVSGMSAEQYMKFHSLKFMQQNATATLEWNCSHNAYSLISVNKSFSTSSLSLNSQPPMDAVAE